MLKGAVEQSYLPLNRLTRIPPAHHKVKYTLQKWKLNYDKVVAKAIKLFFFLFSRYDTKGVLMMMPLPTWNPKSKLKCLFKDQRP